MKTKNLILMCSPALLLVQSVGAQTITAVQLSPNRSSAVTAVSAAQQAGYYVNSANDRHASIWPGSASSLVDINPAGAIYSEVHGMSDNQQVGVAIIGGCYVAGLWTGTAGSFVNLNPAGATASVASSTSGGQQAGMAMFGNENHAGYWSGTANSWVDLHPAGATSSEALATTETQQAGYFNGNRAALWSGTAGSLVNLHPGGELDGSTAFGLTSEYQVGVMDPYGKNRIGVMWFGSAESMVNMNPPGAWGSALYAACGDYQVGYGVFGNKMHAGIWNGTAASFLDLNSYLGGAFTDSDARAIWMNETTIIVGGAGYRDGYEYPVMWTINPVPEPSALALIALAALCAIRHPKKAGV
jgi:hypothetical protein